MQTSRIGVLPGSLTALVLTVALCACGGDKKNAATAGKTEAKTPAADGKTDEVKAPDDGAAASGGSGSGGAEADAASTAGGTGGANPADTGGSGAGGTAAGSGEAEAGGSGEPAGATTGGEPAGTTGAAVDTKALIKELKRKRTKDKRATEIVAELEAAEVETMEIAKALTARGKALFATPERAKACFELALEKDPKIPDPAFELAKQAAMLGESELEEAKKWLKVVKERKGKKLLKQIEFDPMWEVLKDDPEVRALLK